MKLRTIVYLSKAAVPVTEKRLKKMLKGARERNAKNGITGVLLFADGVFLQLIEGESKEVVKLYKKIKADRHHKILTVLVNAPSKKRAFPGWEMHYSDTTRQEMSNFLFLNHYTDIDESAIETIEILKQFCEDKGFFGRADQ